MALALAFLAGLLTTFLVGPLLGVLAFVLIWWVIT